jgi:NDP-sugar pyrophosphorylase family protein
MKNVKTHDLFDLEKTLAADFLNRYEYPWEALPHIKEFILQLGTELPDTEYSRLSDTVWISREAHITPSAFIEGPAIIGPGTQIRHCAFIRGSVLIGANCVVGNSTEMKNAILFDSVQIPHFNYVGDSILGYRAHMGAGAVTSNVKSDRTFVTVRADGEQIVSNMKKFGAMVGDYAEIGCNTVLNPGTIIGRHTNIYPCSCVRGVIPADSIYKSSGKTVRKLERS